MIVRILRTAEDFSPVTSTVVSATWRTRSAPPSPPSRAWAVVQEPPGNRPRPVPGPPPLAGQTRDGGPALWRRADALGRVHPRAGGPPSGYRRRGHDHHRAPPEPDRLGRIVREHGSSPGSSSSATRRPAEEITEFNSGIYAFALDGALRRAGPDQHRRTSKASTTSPTWSASSAAMAGGRDPLIDDPDELAASTAAPSSPS